MAQRPLATGFFSMSHNQCVIFIVQRHILAERRLKSLAQGFVRFLALDCTEAHEHPSRVGVDDKYWTPERVQQYVIRRLWSNTMDSQQGAP